MRIGCHVPTAGGYEKMVDYIDQIGAECYQIFAKSPRQWHSKDLDPAAVELLASLTAERHLGSMFTHTAYLINLTTSNDELREKSVKALADELTRGARLGAVGVNTHMGNVPDGDVDEAIVRASRAIEDAFALAGGAEHVKTRLVLENTAGAGSTFGGPIADLAAIIDGCDLPRESLGICIDTCHAWAYGYDVATAEGWEGIHSEIDSLIGLDRWVLIHANDCKYERGSKKDRHEWIGDGFIGLDGFDSMIHLPGTEHVCICTEMPGEMPEKDVVNIERLRALRDGQ